MFGLNRIDNLSSHDVALEKLVTREPISIFKQRRNVKDGKEKERLDQLLELLRKKLPEGFKIGVALGEGDCFFDSIAQGLNELRDKGLITNSKELNVKSLRESCKQYAQQVNKCIEFTAEDFVSEYTHSEIKIPKLENGVWGRPEVEGKMICEMYCVKIRIIELRDEEIDGSYVTKCKVGTSNNIIYIAKYRNHFVPLLSNIEKDIKRSLKVFREEVYGNVICSNSNNICQSHISISLQDIKKSRYKQSNYSKSSDKENHKTSQKRVCSVTEKNVLTSKRLRIEYSEQPIDFQDESKQNELDNTFQTKQYIPHHLISLMYRIDLSVLCLLRKFTYKHKYPSLLLMFGTSECDKFSNTILRCNEKSIHIQIENVDKYYIDSCISYTKLFTREKEKRSFFMNDYFDCFVKHLIFNSDGSLNNIEYLIIYTNSGLDLTEEKKLKKCRSGSFYPFTFNILNMKECSLLRDVLFTSENEEEHILYQFLQDETTKGQLLKRLEFSSAALKIIKEKEFSQIEIKQAFLNKLVFAVNQPNREELNRIIKLEIKKNKEVDNGYLALQESVLRDLTDREKHKASCVRMIYEFRLLVLFMHDMFSSNNKFSINLEGDNYDVSSDIVINYKGRAFCIKTCNADSNIGYSQLFPSRQKNNMFSINKHFAHFAEGIKNERKYFIIYTNTDLNITEEKKLKNEKSKGFFPFKFDNKNIQKRKYKILRDCPYINENGFYKFSQEDTTKFLNLLELPPSLQKAKEEGRFSNENEKELKEKFLAKLILAVNQPNSEKLNNIIKNGFNNVSYNYEELHEIGLRWSESHELGPITKVIMEKLLEDIKRNRSSCQEIRNKNIDEEIKFAKSVIGRKGTPTFNQFLDFLIKGEGMKYLEVLKRNGINPTNMSSILNRTGNNAMKAFKELYDLWFDTRGNKTKFLKNLEDEGVNLSNMSSILNGAGNSAAKAFKDLNDLWFDAKGNKTQYLKTLEEEGVNLPNMTSILSGAGPNSTIAFRDLYDLWFDEEGNKTKYLKTLEDEGLNLPNVSSILNGAGNSAAKAFKHLYLLWFDAKGNKTHYLKSLEYEGVNLPNMSSILSGAGPNAAKAFKDLYDLWFDAKGNKTHYLKTLEDEGVNLPNMSSILSRAGVNAAKAFKGLYDLWFDKEGKKKQNLKTLEDEGMNIANISSILHGAAANSTKAFQDLYNIWFDDQGNKTQHLKHFLNKKERKQSFTLRNLSSIFNGAGVNVRDAFKKLHSVCFNDTGESTGLLDDFYEAGFRPRHLSCVLCGTGIRAHSTLKKLHGVCFNYGGKRTDLLEDFYKAGFRPGDLCNALSAAVDSLKKFHDFCFLGETKKYLNHFLSESAGFTPSDLAEILHGARANVCPILKDFHDVCFDEAGNKTQLLNDLYRRGFRASDLSNILSMAGNNATPILKKFHKLCVDKENYLNHFLVEKELFTPKNLSRTLHRAGLNISTVFEKLHFLCFDNEGRKTTYLKNLIKNNQNNVFDILREEVKKSSCFLKRM